MNASALILVVVIGHVAIALAVAGLILHRRQSPPGHPSAHAHGVLAAVGRAVAALVARGVRLGPVRLLTVRGRTSGIARSTPVDVFTAPDGRTWLVATHTAQAQWVRNLRAAQEGVLSRGRDQFAFVSAELDTDQAARVLTSVVAPRLARPWGGFVLRRTLGLSVSPSPAQLAETVREHPVFALTAHPDPDAVARPEHDRAFVPRHLIGISVVVAFLHAFAGALGLIGAVAWMSGVALGLLVAGLGNHLRLASRSA